MNGKKKRHVILSILAVVVLAAGILGGREVWLYEHPEIQIRFSHDRSEDLYRSYPICSIRSRSHIGQGYAKQYGEELRQYWEATNEVFVWISEQYRKPLYVTSDVTIGDGKTVILFRGTGTSMTTGETEEIHRDCVLDFEMHAEVLRSEEEPELTVSDWNPEEEGQQEQAETIYDSEAGVTVTLRRGSLKLLQMGLALRSIGAGRVPDGVRCLPENRGRGKRSEIPGVHPFSTLKESDFLLDRWVGRM
mgnify:CR=1 FL=1